MSALGLGCAKTPALATLEADFTGSRCDVSDVPIGDIALRGSQEEEYAILAQPSASHCTPGGTDMKLPRRTFLHLAAGAAAMPALPRVARAEAYPARTVTII